MPGTQTKERPDLLPDRPAAVTAQQKTLIITRKYHRRIADRIHAGANAALNLPERNLVTDNDRGFQTPAARPLQIESRRLRRQPTPQYALPRQIPVFRMLDDRSTAHIAQPLAAQTEFVHDALERRG